MAAFHTVSSRSLHTGRLERIDDLLMLLKPSLLTMLSGSEKSRLLKDLISTAGRIRKQDCHCG